MAKTTFDDIKRALWAGANTFRDNIDASNNKQVLKQEIRKDKKNYGRIFNKI